MNQNWTLKESDYHSYKILETTVIIGSRPDYGFSDKLYKKIDFFISLTESWVEYSSEKPYLWFPWKETSTIFPDTVFFPILKTLYHLIHNLKLKTIYMHCDLGTHRAPAALGAFLYFYHSDRKNEIVRNVETPMNSRYIINNKLMANPNDYFFEKLERDPQLKYLGEYILSHDSADLESVLKGYRTNLPDNLLTPKELKERIRKRKIEDQYTKFNKVLRDNDYVFFDDGYSEFYASKKSIKIKVYLWGIPNEEPHGVLGLDLNITPVLILVPKKFLKNFVDFNNNRFRYEVEYHQGIAFVHVSKSEI